MTSGDLPKKDFKLYLIVIMIAITIITSAIIVNFIVTQKKFTNFYFLDEDGQLNYPKTIQVNHLYNISVNIQNQEQQVMLYKVYVKLGNITTSINHTHPATLIYAMTSFVSALRYTEGHRQVVRINATIVQDDTKLIAELWNFDVNKQVFIYSGKFLFIGFNVTT